jgi:UDP-N-acetylmuramoyl-tripeptide--D-alanyl-D-alanine ligase
MSGMTPDEIRAGLLLYEPSGYRQNLTHCGGVTFLEDCYNASPESMHAALEVLRDYSQQNGRRSVAVLGDMLELGSQSGALHRRVGAHLATLGIDRLVTVGKNANQIAIGARQMGMSPNAVTRTSDSNDVEGIASQLAESVQEGDVILFKASRAVGLERVITALKEKLSGEA